MSYRWKRRGLTLAFFILSIAVPILFMSICSGWNEGSMKVAECTPNWMIIQSVANSFYAFMLVASFMMGIPILIYLIVMWVIGCVLAVFVIKKPEESV